MGSFTTTAYCSIFFGQVKPLGCRFLLSKFYIKLIWVIRTLLRDVWTSNFEYILANFGAVTVRCKWCKTTNLIHQNSFRNITFKKSFCFSLFCLLACFTYNIRSTFRHMFNFLHDTNRHSFHLNCRREMRAADLSMKWHQTRLQTTHDCEKCKKKWERSNFSMKSVTKRDSRRRTIINVKTLTPYSTL